MVPPARLPAMLAEMVRVAKPGASVAVGFRLLPDSASLFGLLESLITLDLAEHAMRPRSCWQNCDGSQVEASAELEGMEKTELVDSVEEFDYESGENS